MRRIHKNNKRGFTFTEILLIVAIVLVVALVVGTVILKVFAFIEYGDKPISEVPAWAYWIMQSGNGNN